MRLTPAWILGALAVITPVATLLVASRLPLCPDIELDPHCHGGLSLWLLIFAFAILSSFMFGMFALIAARPSSIGWRRVRRALLLLVGGLATLEGLRQVAITAWLFEFSTRLGLMAFLSAVVVMAIGVQGLIELWVDIRSSRSADVSAT